MTKELSNLSGLKINTDKTKAIWLGPGSPKYILSEKIKWANTDTKLLGIYICSNIDEMIILNYNKKNDKIKKNINIWQKRSLSLTGKILIIKALGLSQIMYLSNMLPFPDAN